MLVRPLLDIPKSRLIATLERAKIHYADDPSNRDPRFTRARLRELTPMLAREGIDARALALMARRLRRAEAAIETAVDAAAAELMRSPPQPSPFQGEGVHRARGFAGDSNFGNDVMQSMLPACGPIGFDAGKFAQLPAEVALRVLGRAVAHIGDEGPVELGKLEALFDQLCNAGGNARAKNRLRRTLAGAVVTLTADNLVIERAPPRRSANPR